MPRPKNSLSKKPMQTSSQKPQDRQMTQKSSGKRSEKQEKCSESNRNPVQSKKAEEAIIGSILIDNSVLDDVVPIVKPEDFFSVSNREIFEIIVDLYSRGEAVDPLILEDKLEEAESLDFHGGIDRINHLVDCGTTAHELESYAKRVADLASVRRVQESIIEMRQTNHADFDSVSDYLADIDGKFQRAMERRKSGNTERINTMMQSACNHLMDLYDKKETGTLEQLSTGFIDLDKTVMMDASDLIILAARPSMGKSALAVNVVENSCPGPNDAALFFSLEMSKLSLALRMLSGKSRIELNKFRNVEISGGDISKIAMATSYYRDLHLYFDDTPAITVSEMRAISRRLKNKLERQGKRLRLIGLDYMQLCGTKRGHSRNLELAEVSGSLKALAKELSVPVLALSQLSRAVEQRENKRPRMADLRDSGALEQDADVILFMYRDDYYNENSEDKGITEVIVGKQRNGALGTVHLKFIGEQARFANLAKGHHDERF